MPVSYLAQREGFSFLMPNSMRSGKRHRARERGASEPVFQASENVFETQMRRRMEESERRTEADAQHLRPDFTTVLLGDERRDRQPKPGRRGSCETHRPVTNRLRACSADARAAVHPRRMPDAGELEDRVASPPAPAAVELRGASRVQPANKTVKDTKKSSGAAKKTAKKPTGPAKKAAEAPKKAPGPYDVQLVRQRIPGDAKFRLQQLAQLDLRKSVPSFVYRVPQDADRAKWSVDTTEGTTGAYRVPALLHNSRVNMPQASTRYYYS